jgi:SAM-dependent methyltransferase
MPETRTTWHYGLVARWWAEFNVDGPEIDYFRAHVERGQPALDVACGTGRLLIPFLRAGLDVDGCDVSADMIELCRERARREGVSPTLFVQPMHELDPPRRYRTIFVCGGFGLGSTRDQDAEALRRFHASLEPGGTLVIDNENPYAGGSPWRYWQAEGRTAMPREWEPLETVERRRAADGSELALQSRVVDLDPLEQCLSSELRAGLWQDGELVQREEHTLRLNLYFMHELLLLLERAGFEDVVVHGDHVEEPPTRDSTFLVFVARRAA